MPKLLGMEPDTVSKVKPLLLIGGGGLLLFFILKGRGTPDVAAEAPSGSGPVAGVQSPAAQPELSQTGSVVDALQQQMQQHQMEYDTAAGNLALQAQSQQMHFQQLSDEYSLQRQKQLDAQQDAITHEQFKQLKNQGKTGGFFGSLLKTIGTGFGIYTQAAGAGLVPVPYPQNKQPTIAKPYSYTPPFYPTPSGRPIGQ